MLRLPVLVRLLRECRRLGVRTAITSNGFWGRNRIQVRRYLRALTRAGLSGLTVSYDRYHAEFQGPNPILAIARAAEGGPIPLRINLVRGTDEAELADVVASLGASRGARLGVYDLQPVGRARALPASMHRGEVEGLCTACSVPAITDDGRVVACNGPSYFESSESPLVLGSLRHESFAELLDRHRRDPILDTIRTRGPAGLRDQLQRIPGFEHFPFRARYAGICDLCHHVTRDAPAVAALRDRLGRPDAVATRLATWQVIEGNRQQGTLSVSHVNGIGACRVFLAAACNGPTGLGHAAERILGRADLDYRGLADYLKGCGLARPLLPVLDTPELTRWAPRFFLDALRSHAMSDGFRELVQREVIQRVAGALRDLGGRGVLLKGTALLLRKASDLPPRATTDVDILVEPRLAPLLRAHLLERGFEGASEAGPSAEQHLEPIFYQGMAVEIHTRIMPPFWGLPETEMLAGVRTLDDTDVLATLSPEAMLLHAGTHASAAFFSFGLKTAWDVLTILRTDPDLDWERLAALANASRAPRGFWIPTRVLAEELGLPVPASFLRHAPVDRALRAATVARHRLFRAADGIFDLDVLTKAGLTLLLLDNWRTSARYIGSRVLWRGRRPATWGGVVTRAKRADTFRQAWHQYRRYRRAITRVAPGPRDLEA